MGLDLTVTGADRLHQLAAQIKTLGDKGLGREMSKALTGAVTPITAAINREAGETAPSGYRESLTASLRHRRTVRSSTRQASVRVTTTAKGKTQDRDLPSLNAGELRHPVFGRARRLKTKKLQKNPWAVTKVRAGFHDRATRGAADEAEKKLDAVLAEFSEKLGGS